MMEEIAETEEIEAQETSKRKETSKQKKRSCSQERLHSGVSDVTMEDLADNEGDFRKYEELVS